jgi:radical SAM superfamily enzyme YgiQ (UPF0313 family)
MVILGSWHGQSLTLSIKPNCLTLSLQSGRDSTVYSWDNTGRLWTAMAAGISFRRGLDGKIVAKWQIPSGGRERRWLPEAEAGNLQEQARMQAARLLADLTSGELRLIPRPSAQEEEIIVRAAGFDPARYDADVRGYHAVYDPVGILPPDQYMAVVLQAALGCSFNTCTFCTFYRGRRFRVRPPQEYREHAEAVRDYLGEGLSLRRTVFLGDANALVIPMPRLIEILEITRSVYDVDRLGGIYAFLDGFSGEKKTAADFALLAAMGLKRIYIGLESGHDPLLRLLKKPGQAIDALHAVRAMKAGGVSVGIIVLLGAGGKQYAQAHVADTAFLLNRMDLDADDLIYFSELVETGSSAVSASPEGDETPLLEYTRDAYAQNLTPLTSAQRIAQGEEIESLLFFNPDRGVPHISRYDIREFVY